MFRLVKAIRIAYIRHKESIERCNSCSGWHAVGNHGPCETCIDGSNYDNVANVFCSKYNEKCRFGMNCNYCNEVHEKEYGEDVN